MLQITEETAGLLADAPRGLIRGLIRKLGTNLIDFLAWIAASPQAKIDLAALIAASISQNWLEAVAAEGKLIVDWKASHGG